MRVAVAVAVGTFRGDYDQIWVGRDAWRSFVADLGAFEAARAGTACLRAMSPDEFELTFRIGDGAGHIAVDGFLGRLHWHRFLSAFTTRIAFCIELDPSRLREVADEFAALDQRPMH